MDFNLNYEGFEKYLVEKKRMYMPEGVQYIFRFANDYGASVVKNSMSYGHDEGLWEFAVIVFNTPITNDVDDWDITYDTPITDDVIGWLTDEGVRNWLEHVKNLKGE